MPSYNLLYIEDSVSDQIKFQEFFREFFEEQSICVYVVDNSIQAFNFFSSFTGKIHICVVDVELGGSPTMDGLDFINTAKLHRPEINFITLTSDFSEEALERAASVGSSAVILKKELVRRSYSRLCSLIRYACLHSAKYLMGIGQKEIRYSESLSHMMLRELQRHENLVESIGSDTNISQNSIDNIEQLTARYSRLRDKMSKVLQLYSRSYAEDFEFEECSVKQEVERVASKFFDQIKISFEINIEDDKIVMSRDLFSLALDNLIDNAIKYTDGVPGAELILIRVHQRENFAEGNYFVFEVVDWGYGLPSDQKDLITLPGYVGPDGKKDMSFGIGLAETVRIALAHRNDTAFGFLEFDEPEPDKGFIARLVLPAESLPPNNRTSVGSSVES